MSDNCNDDAKSTKLDFAMNKPNILKEEELDWWLDVHTTWIQQMDYQCWNIIALGDEVVPEIYEKIKSLPSAQPEIIRCKDCKWSQTINFFGTKATSCKWWEKLTDVDAFCSNGVRRNEDE